MIEKHNQTSDLDTTLEAEEVNQEILDKYNDESKMRNFDNKKVIAWIVFIVAILYSAFHLWIQFNPLPTLKQRSIHVAVGLALIFLMFPTYKKQLRTKVPIYDWLFFGLSFFTAIYILIEYTEIVNVRSGIPNNLDIAVGIVTVLLVLEAARQIGRAHV